MFKKSKSKSSAQLGSKESIESGRSNQSTSSGHLLSGSLERLHVASVAHAPVKKRLFQLNFLGMVQDVNLGGTRRNLDIQLIDKVEEAQLEGKLNLVAKEERRIILGISKHGLTVYDLQTREVFQRHPLHTVAQIVQYQDSFSKHNLALKIGQVGRPVYHVFVFQAPTEEDANGVCSGLNRVFDAVTTHAT